MLKIINFLKDKSNREFLFLSVAILIAVIFSGIMMDKISDVTMCVDTNDYYQYIKLGENIFQQGDFTVRHQTGEPIPYPPVFSMLIYLMTFATKDPLISIHLLNTLAYGLSIFFIYMLTKSLFNAGMALLASLFYACSVNGDTVLWYLSVHSFFVVAVVGLGWLNWSIIKGKESPFRLILCGVLACLTMLTKKVGMAYVPIIIFTYLFYNRGSEKILSTKRVKRIGYFLLGFLLIFIPYKIKVYQRGQEVKLYNNGSRAFISGNLIFDPKVSREKEYYQLNKAEDDFLLLEKIEQTSMLSFAKEHPRFMFEKYGYFFKRFFKYLSGYFVVSSQRGRYIYFVFILLGLAAFFSLSNNPQAFYVFLWLSPSLMLPFIIVKPMYVWPFLPFYIILFIWGGRNIAQWIKFRHIVSILFIFVLLFFTFQVGKRNVLKQPYCYKPKTEYTQAASLIKEDAALGSGEIKIMARKTYIAHLAGADYIALPYEMDWNKIIRFALAKDVDYIVLARKEGFLRRSRLFKTKPRNKNIKFLFEEASNRRNKILVYKIINK